MVSPFHARDGEYDGLRSRKSPKTKLDKSRRITNLYAVARRRRASVIMPGALTGATERFVRRERHQRSEVRPHVRRVSGCGH